MLWAYLDDSAIHARESGAPRRYALGGGVATTKVWQELTSAWQRRLEDPASPSRVTWFHFREWKRAYWGHAKAGDALFGWTQPHLTQLLNDLATIVSKREVHYLCASVRPSKGNRIVRDSYREVVRYVITRAELIPRWLSQEDQISFMFSKHPELPGVRIQTFFEFLKRAHPLTDACEIGDPRNEVPLQVADLIVNHMARSRKSRPSYGPKLLMPFMTQVMAQLNRQPPFHHMLEWHVDDDLGNE